MSPAASRCDELVVNPPGTVETSCSVPCTPEWYKACPVHGKAKVLANTIPNELDNDNQVQWYRTRRLVNKAGDPISQCRTFKSRL